VRCGVPAQAARKRLVVKSYHDTKAKPLPPLVIGQPTRVKAHPQQAHSNWKPGLIVDSVALRSYIVEVDGRTYRRNRVHLRAPFNPVKPSQTRNKPLLPRLQTHLATTLAKMSAPHRCLNRPLGCQFC